MGPIAADDESACRVTLPLLLFFVRDACSPSASTWRFVVRVLDDDDMLTLANSNKGECRLVVRYVQRRHRISLESATRTNKFFTFPSGCKNVRATRLCLHISLRKPIWSLTKSHTNVPDNRSTPGTGCGGVNALFALYARSPKRKFGALCRLMPI